MAQKYQKEDLAKTCQQLFVTWLFIAKLFSAILQQYLNLVSKLSLVLVPQGNDIDMWAAMAKAFLNYLLFDHLTIRNQILKLKAATFFQTFIQSGENSLLLFFVNNFSRSDSFKKLSPSVEKPHYNSSGLFLTLSLSSSVTRCLDIWPYTTVTISHKP